MTPEKAKEGMRLVDLIAKIKNSAPYMICERVLGDNAPYLFGHPYYKIDNTSHNELCISASFGFPLEMLEYKDEVQEEYIRFIERVKKVLDKRIAHYEAQLSVLKAE